MKITNLKHLLLLTLLAGIALSGCASKETVTVKIVPDIETYIPTMSSVQGFTLTAEVTPPQEDDYKYYWSTISGSFITASTNPDSPSTSIVTESEKALWTPDFSNMDQTTYEVTVMIKDINGVEIANDKIEFIRNEDLTFSLKK